MRFVFLHNHIFKNAGSTIDHLFERAGFVHTRMEPGTESASVYPSEVVEAVRKDPSIEYVSSHVFRRPRPADLENLGFVDITFVRHPIDRLYSMYRYFRQEGPQDFPFVDKGATFPAFVDALAQNAPGHLQSPQTCCLGNDRDFYFPPQVAHLARAKDTVADTRFLGVVDLFAESVEVFLNCCAALMPGKDLRPFEGPFPVVNRASEPAASLEAKLAHIRDELGAARYARIENTYAADLQLYRFARDELLRRHALAGSPAAG